MRADSGSPLTSTDVHRRRSPAERLQVACALYDEARRLKAAMLRVQHPDWDEDEVQRAVRNVFLYGRTHL